MWIVPGTDADRRRPLMRVMAIVPQQRLSLAKSRLAPVLDPHAREILSLALLHHVCGVLRQVPAVEAVTIMTPDPAVRRHAARWGIPSCPDLAAGLNAALEEAIASAALAGTAAYVALAVTAARAGLTRKVAGGSDSGGRHGVLVIAADLPHLSMSDVVALIGAAGARTLVLAPAKDGTGTNALVVPWGMPFRPAYGMGSRTAHRREAIRADLRPVEVHRPGLAFDVDLPEDLMSPGYRRCDAPWRGQAGGPDGPGAGSSAIACAGFFGERGIGASAIAGSSAIGCAGLLAQWGFSASAIAGYSQG